MRKFLRRFRNSKSGLAYLWAVALATLVFMPIIVWPLNTALINLEESIGYTFTGPDLFAMQVINICTSYVLFFVAIGVVYWALIRSKNTYEGGYQ
jgi:hypothetical protein